MDARGGLQQPVPELVGHQGASAPWVTCGGGGGGVPGEGGVGGDAVDGGEQRGQVGHGVGCGPEGDAPVGDGFAVAADGLFGVEAVADTGGGAAGLPWRHGAVPLGEFGVDGLPVFPGQGRCFGDDEHRLVLVEDAFPERVVEVRHLPGEGLCQPDQSGADAGADPTGQPDLRPDVATGPLPHLLGGDACQLLFP